MTSQAVMRDWKRRPRSVAFYDSEAAFVHSTIDEVVAVLPPDGLLEREECFLLLEALYGTRKASKRWQQHYTKVLKRFGWRASSVMAGPIIKTWLARFGCHGDDDFMAEGGDDLLTSLDKILMSEFEAKLLGRVGRRHRSDIMFFKTHSALARG